jgi:plastocyanin
MGPRLTTAALVIGVGALLAVPAVAAGTQPTEIGLGEAHPAPTGAALESARVATAATPAERPSTIRTTASASGASAVTIRDFSFSPGGVTVHAGDAVTWTNGGKVAHTATGDGIDSGTLDPGKSYSHTFSSAGTFSYVCKIHPFMKGKITVLPSSASSPSPSSGGGSSGSGASTTARSASSSSTASPASTGSSGSLPMTGFELWLLALTGLELAACGFLLRRLAR